jgi:hypothetical protein
LPIFVGRGVLRKVKKRLVTGIFKGGVLNFDSPSGLDHLPLRPENACPE